MTGSTAPASSSPSLADYTANRGLCALAVLIAVPLVLLAAMLVLALLVRGKIL